MAIEDLFDQIGGFGRFQLLMIVGVYSMKFTLGWSMMMMTFAGHIPDYLCETSDPDLDPDLHANMTDNLTDIMNVCAVNGSRCEHFRFLGSARTAISEWHLVCDLAVVKPAVTSVQMAGVLLGAVVSGQSGDYLGRKLTIYSCFLYHTIVNVAAAFSTSWQMFAVFRFLIGAGVGATLVMVVPYPAEFLPIAWRPIIPITPMWCIGVGLFAGSAWLLENWKYLHLACAAFGAPVLLGAFYFPESVRWLTVHGRVDDAYAVLQKMARMNGKTVPENTMSTLQEIAHEESERRRGGRKYSYLDVFRGAGAARVTFIFTFKWLSMSIIFYGLSFGVSSLAGNIYLNIFLMGVVEVPVIVSTFYFVNRFGRKGTSVGYLAIGAVSAFGCLAVRELAPEEVRGDVISGLSLTAKVAVAAAWVTSQIWIIEVYPTVTRSLGYGAANTASRIGGILAPFAINLDDMVVFSYSLVAGLLVCCVVCVLFLPETRGAILPESMQHDDKARSSVAGSDADVIKSHLQDTSANAKELEAMAGSNSYTSGEKNPDVFTAPTSGAHSDRGVQRSSKNGVDNRAFEGSLPQKHAHSTKDLPRDNEKSSAH